MPGNKRMLGVAILNVLKEYSDAEHPLKRNDIIALVQKHYCWFVKHMLHRT